MTEEEDEEYKKALVELSEKIVKFRIHGAKSGGEDLENVFLNSILIPRLKRLQSLKLWGYPPGKDVLPCLSASLTRLTISQAYMEKTWYSGIMLPRFFLKKGA